MTSSKGGYVLIIAEKPRAASKIAAALGIRSRVRLNGVTYWKGSFGGRDVVIAPAVGHLFTLKTRRRSYPVFEYEYYRHRRTYLNLVMRVTPVSPRWLIELFIDERLTLERPVEEIPLDCTGVAVFAEGGPARVIRFDRWNLRR